MSLIFLPPFLLLIRTNSSRLKCFNLKLSNEKRFDDEQVGGRRLPFEMHFQKQGLSLHGALWRAIELCR